MRHGNKGNHLGRTASHRKALLSNLANALITNKRISTTTAKAKALRQYIEPLLTKSKDNSTHSRRIVFSYLKNKDAVKLLFDEVAEKIANRPGGYTRILKLGQRHGDNADMSFIELVDFSTIETTSAPEKAEEATTKRTRRGGKKKATGAPAAAETEVAEEKEEKEEKAPAKKATPKKKKKTE
jgi:large subunit ribosomal protein L17